MATREAVDRWQSVLLSVEQYVTRPRGQQMRVHLSTRQARADFRMVNATLVYGVVEGTLTTPITDLRSVDPPTDPVLLALLQPVFDAAAAFTPHKELLPQRDHFASVARTARLKLDTEPTDHRRSHRRDVVVTEDDSLDLRHRSPRFDESDC